MPSALRLDRFLFGMVCQANEFREVVYEACFASALQQKHDIHLRISKLAWLDLTAGVPHEVAKQRQMQG